MLQVIPMTIEQALKAAETYNSPVNGGMVQVLANEVRRLTAILETPITCRIYKDNDVIVNVIDLAKKCSVRIPCSSNDGEGKP